MGGAFIPQVNGKSIADWTEKVPNAFAVQGIDKSHDLLIRAFEQNLLNQKALAGRKYALCILKRTKEALSKDPQNTEAWYNRATAQAELGRYEEALHSYNCAIKLNPLELRSWQNKGNTLCMLGRQSEAIECFDWAIERDPKDPRLWVNRGSALLEQGKPEDAIASLDMANQLDPNIPEAWFNKGLAFLQMDRYEEAVNCFDQVISIDPVQHTLCKKALAFRKHYRKHLEIAMH
jgi:tetratricopeptide (TPR) repeat protein